MRARSFTRVFVALLSLTTLAFAQSIYQAIAGNREFVVLNQISHADLLLIIFCFNVVPALLLVAFWSSGRRISDHAGNVVLSAAFVLLTAPFLFELHKAYVSPFVGFSHNTVLILLPLTLITFLAFRFRDDLEHVLVVLSAVIVLLPALFLLRVWDTVAVTGITPPQKTVVPVEGQGLSYPPIFIVIFDEFTRPALLDSHGNIDSARFPHFAELAQHSTWFTNATANAEYTARSIPVIVTGNFPHGSDASDKAYPDNLFRLMVPTYDVTIHEEVTSFCAEPAYRCPDSLRVRSRGHMLRSVIELYLLRVAPRSVVASIEIRALRLEQQRFRDFLSEIGAPADRPRLEFMHLQLPHAPYMLNPDGSIHVENPAGFDPTLVGNAAVVARLHDDYEKQVQFVDRELGMFLDKLKQAGLYEDALIIVTSDHGVSWHPEAPGRVLSEANADMIFPVPLFIKLPHQTEANVSRKDVQLIDLLPTIVAVAGVRVPWQVAGRDAFAADALPHEKIMVDSNGRTFAYPSNFAESVPSQ